MCIPFDGLSYNSLCVCVCGESGNEILYIIEEHQKEPLSCFLVRAYLSPFLTAPTPTPSPAALKIL